MREILFRGKSTIDGRWEEGIPVPTTTNCYVKGYEIIDKEGIDYDELDSYIPSFSAYTVDPETIGQYTGLTDKNGKKIFEGDVVQYYGTYALEVYIDNGHTQVRWFDTVTKSECSELFFGDDEAYGECEVIGNIHDNPELLKGEKI